MTKIHNDISDQQLLRYYLSASAERAREAAFARVVDRHKDWIYSVCLRRTGSEACWLKNAAQAVAPRGLAAQGCVTGRFHIRWLPGFTGLRAMPPPTPAGASNGAAGTKLRLGK